MGLDLVDPEVDFVSLNRLLGVETHRITGATDLDARLETAISGSVPVTHSRHLTSSESVR